MAQTIPQDPAQAIDDNAIIEHEFTEEDVERLAHPNIRIEDNRVAVTGSLPVLSILGSLLFYITAILILVMAGLMDLSVLPCAGFIVATGIFIAYLARLRVVTVFDGFDKEVHRRNLLYRMSDIPFCDIAELTVVNDMGSVFFKIAMKANRLGRGVRVTRNYAGGDEELLYMLFKALPAIHDLIGEYGDAEREQALAMLAESPLLYSREGARYTFVTWRNQILSFLLCAFMLLAYAETVGWIRWIGLGMGCFGFFAGFAVTHRIVIDTGERTIRFSNLLRLLCTTLPLDRYSGFRVVREHTNGIYTHTSAYLEFREPPLSVDLYWGVGTKRLSALVDETVAIITSVIGSPNENSTPGQPGGQPDSPTAE